MKISDIKRPKGLKPCKSAEVDALEAALWIALPAKYREYVTTLGEGALSGFVRIYPPARIQRELTDWRKRIDKYWFWDKSKKLLPKERALEAIIIGDTINGDELIFHPARPKSLFVLPRHADKIFVAGDDLLSAVEWMCTSGKLVKRIREYVFELFEFDQDESATNEGRVADPPGSSIDDLVELGALWAKRHKVRKLVEEELEDECGADKKGELLFEAICLQGEFPKYKAGYIAVLKVNDTSGKLLGTFYFGKKESSYSRCFEPEVRANKRGK